MPLLKNSLNWIKKQFVVEEVPAIITPAVRPEEISLAELQSWAEKKEKEYFQSSGINELANQYINNIKDLRWKLEGKIDEWEGNFPPIKKLKREEIFRLFGKIRQFAGMVAFSEQATVREVMAVNAGIEPKLDFLIRKLENTTYSREYSLALDGEEKEVVESVILSPLLSELQKILKLKDEFDKKVAQSDLGKWADLKENILDLFGMKLTLDELEAGVESRQGHLKLVEEKILEKEQEISQIQERFSLSDSEEELEQKKKEGEMALQKDILEENIHHFFARIKPAMKQYYLRNPGNKLIIDYFEDPFEAFSKDQGLEILGVIEELKNNLKPEGADNLRLSPQEAEEIISQFQTAGETLRSHQELWLKISSELGNKEINTLDHFASLKIGDAQYRLNHFKVQAERLRQEIEDSGQRIQEQLALQRTEAEKVQQRIRLLVGKEVEVKV